MPAQEPGLEMAWIKEPPGATAFILAGRPFGLGQIAPGTTEGQVTHHGLPALRPRAQMFDVKRDARGSLHQSAILTGAPGASLDQLPVGFDARHALALGRLGLDPNCHRNRTLGPTPFFALRKLREPPRIRYHQPLGFGDELLERLSFPA